MNKIIVNLLVSLIPFSNTRKKVRKIFLKNISLLDRFYINRVFLNVKITSIKFLLHSTSKCFLINNRWILKFVTRDIAEHNVHISNILTSILTEYKFPVVNIVRKSIGFKRQCVITYPYLQGKSIDTLKPSLQSMRDLAEFIAKLHSLNVDKIGKLLPYRMEYLRVVKADEVLRILNKDISEECLYIEKIFNKYKLQKNILIHGDLGFPNLLFNDENHLIGVLDLDTIALTNNPLFELTAFRYMKMDDLFLLIDMINQFYKKYDVKIYIERGCFMGN